MGLNAATRLTAGMRKPENDKLEKILHAIKAASFQKVINIAQDGDGMSDELVIQIGAPITGHQLVQFAKALHADVDHITLHPGNHSVDVRISSFMVK